MSTNVGALAILAAVIFLIWLSVPKNEQELMETAKHECIGRGGVFYDQDLGNGRHKVCH